MTSVEDQPQFDTVVEAHGILGALAWVIFFPLGAILLRLVPSSKAWLIHAGVMMFALVLFTANAGMGIWQATGELNEFHAIVGLVLFSLAWIQPIGGLAHHFMYKKYSRRTIVSFMHMSIGRAIITLGIIQGGLGLLYAGDGTRSEVIAYGTVGGIIWVAYFIIAFWHDDKAERDRKQEMDGLANASGGKVYEHVQ